MLNPTPVDTFSPVSDDEIRAFVGNNSEYYVANFAKFMVGGIDNFTLTWNWSAFGFTFVWMLYRKMYWQAAVTFVIFCTPGVNLLLHVLVGCAGNYLYFKHAKSKILEVRRHSSAQSLYPSLHQIGGVHSWAITVGIVVALFLIVLFSWFFATISTMMMHFL